MCNTCQSSFKFIHVWLKVKSVDVSERGGKGSSPKYILGVPTSEPLFMKPSGGRTPSGGGTGSSRPQIQTPPRLQKQQQLAQQQLQTHPEEEEEEPSCQPTKQPQKPSQDPAVKLTKIAWQSSPLNELSAPLSTTQQNSVHQMSSLQSSGGQLQPSPQQSPQNGLSVSSGQQKPVAPPHHQNRMASPLTQPQPPGQSPKPVVILQADFRSVICHLYVITVLWLLIVSNEDRICIVVTSKVLEVLHLKNANTSFLFSKRKTTTCTSKLSLLKFECCCPSRVLVFMISLQSFYRFSPNLFHSCYI